MAEALRGKKIRSFRFHRCGRNCRINEKRREVRERVKNLESGAKEFTPFKAGRGKSEENQKSSSLDPHHQHQIFSSNQEEEEEEEEEEKNNFYGSLEAEAKPKPPRASKKRPSSAIFSGESFEYAGEMVDLQREAATTSRMGIRGSGGEIVEVQGGHIVRSIGGKDRHSKVCTAKGPRDRRVRLSAHTAIQFYDVQDRLGYDRPSKAVDWLIKKAKTAIDELKELPAWKPNTLNSISLQQREQRLRQDGENYPDGTHRNMVNTSSSLRSTIVGSGSNTLQNLQFLQMGETPNDSTSSLLPRSLDSDSIADTIKSFFPMGATTSPEISSSTIQFQSHPPAGDLRLSLQCFKDPLSLHHHQGQHQNHQNEHPFFSGASPLPVFDGGSLPHWAEHSNSTHPSPEIGRFQRMVSWNASGAETGGGDQDGGGNGSFIFNLPSNPPPPPPPPLFGETQFFSQRGPLQSSYTPMFRAWIDPSSIPSTNHQIPLPFHQSPFSSLGFASGGFSGIRNPAQFQGEEEHDGISTKRPSASSNSRH